MVIAILICYLVAMALGMLAIHPRSYNKYRYNMTRMGKEWERLITYKKRLVQWAGILFGVGTIALAGLIIFIIWPL